jgi:hypothetical protein
MDATLYDTLKVISRRPVGKGAWRVTITELIESERAGLRHLEAIKKCHPKDAKLQGYVASCALEAAERLAKLNELLHYRGEKEASEGPANGSVK